jgi:hypothetical protein
MMEGREERERSRKEISGGSVSKERCERKERKGARGRRSDVPPTIVPSISVGNERNRKISISINN